MTGKISAHRHELVKKGKRILGYASAVVAECPLGDCEMLRPTAVRQCAA